MGRSYSRLGSSITRQGEHVLDIEISHVRSIRCALADGFQPEDIPVILSACEEIDVSLFGLKLEMLEEEDVDQDFVALMRTITLGRQRIYDDPRVKRREKDLQQMRCELQRKAPTGLSPAGANVAREAIG